MNPSEYRPRCETCAALCCMAPDFVPGARFPEEKPARTPCRHLEGRACGIYRAREERGYHGCIAFTCYGAGQAVTNDLFGGRDWADEPGLREPMAVAFLRLYAVQEARFMLETLAFSGLSGARDAEREAMLAALDPGGAWSAARLAAAEAACPPERVRAWIGGLLPGSG